MQFVVTVLPDNGRASRSDGSILTVETEYHSNREQCRQSCDLEHPTQQREPSYDIILLIPTQCMSCSRDNSPDSLPQLELTRLPTGTSQCQSSTYYPHHPQHPKFEYPTLPTSWHQPSGRQSYPLNHPRSRRHGRKRQAERFVSRITPLFSFDNIIFEVENSQQH